MKNAEGIAPHTQSSQSAAFWDKEYETQEHFALSKNPSEDLEKFCRYLERHHGGFPRDWNVLDVGCGNGRHLIHLAREYGARGVGFDISRVAIEQATTAKHTSTEQQNVLKKSLVEASPKSEAEDFFEEHFAVKEQLHFQTGDIAQPLPGSDGEYDLLLDMMSSHMLPEGARTTFVQECARVLSPGSWLLLKTFLLEEDMHAKRMIAEHPAPTRGGGAGYEKNSYIHPRLGYLEHVYTLAEMTALYSPYFTIEKVLKSHAHIVDGKPNKRRFICVYMTKKKE
jgi:SAM-dependent methyltransferase